MSKAFSVADLKEDTLEIIEVARATKEPVFISQNGQALVAMVDADAYVQSVNALNEFKRIFEVDEQR